MTTNPSKTRPAAQRTELLPLNLPFFDEDDTNAVMRAVKSTFVSGDGPECRRFEADLAKYVGAKYAFFTTSCTAALDLAFMIREFPAGAEVLVPNFTFTSTALAPILNGLRVILVDVDPGNGNLDVTKIEEKITSRTVAIVPVDYAGSPADMDAIGEIAKKHNLYVVHDAAQSIGAEYRGRKTGTLAEISCFSFHGTKNLVVGEGGAIVTDNDVLAAKIVIAREKGTDKHFYINDPTRKGYYEYVARGNSYVQSNILGALGVTQLRKLDWMNQRRRAIAETYNAQFRSLMGVHLPTHADGASTNWHLYYLLVPPPLKERFIDGMRSRQVMANIHYSPLHRNKYYAQVCEFDPDTLRHSVEFFESLVRIPLFPGMTDGDVEDVVSAVRLTCQEVGIEEAR
jgi:perosamine synthetase